MLMICSQMDFQY